MTLLSLALHQFCSPSVPVPWALSDADTEEFPASHPYGSTPLLWSVDHHAEVCFSWSTSSPTSFAGDDKAFEHLILHNSPWIVSMTANQQDDIQDVAQTIWMMSRTARIGISAQIMIRRMAGHRI